MLNRKNSIIELVSNPNAVITDIAKIDAELTTNQALIARLSVVLASLSVDACDVFLDGLILVAATEKAAYLNKWVTLLEGWQHKNPGKFYIIQELFLKQYSWQYFVFPAFLNLIEFMIKPEALNLWSWFESYFESKFNIGMDQSKFDQHILIFQKFADTCVKYNVVNSLSVPDAKNALSFDLQGQSYLESCVKVLDNCSRKEEQAKLMHDLPNEVVIQQAISRKLPIVCSSMVSRNVLPQTGAADLDKTYDISTYKAKALVYLSETCRIDFLSCIKFFNALEKVKAAKLSGQEKILLAKTFVQCAVTPTVHVNTDAFIYWAEKVKIIFGENIFIKLLERIPNAGTQLNDYNRFCQLLIDMDDEVDTDSLLANYSGNLSDLLRELQSKQSAYLLRKYPEKNIDVVLNDFSNQSEFVKFPLSTDEIAHLKSDYLEIQKIGDGLVQEDTKTLVGDAAACGKSITDSPNKIRLIAILREMMRRTYNLYPYNTQILSLLSLINVPEKAVGRIGQIRTGEGKSMIVAMLSAFMASQGKAVDVITISRNLAMRDQYKYEEYYRSLAITSSHICYDQPEKQHFDGQILYATNEDAEFSVLRDSFLNQNLRYTTINGVLIKRPFNVAIVDELDSLFIDAALNSARLAIPATEYTNWVYEPIFKLVLKFGTLLKETPGNINMVREYLKTYNNWKFHEQAATFTDDRLKTWLGSAFRAQEQLKLGIDYIIESVKSADIVKQQVKIVDARNTGRISSDSRWSNGIHEFIEVKHGLQPEDESATLAAISHPSYFSQYEYIFGLTGTLGEERPEIEKTYRVSTFDVPPHFPNQRQKCPPRLIDDYDDYLTQILQSLQKASSQGQPSVALFATIAEAEAFSKYLAEINIKNQLLTGIQQEDEDYILDRAGQPGMITIATNIAGRGADIILTPESKISGGLNLLLTFYPDNLRVEDQAFGRAGRQGQPGTCSMIVHREDRQIKKLVKNEEDRIALCKDPDAFKKLDALRAAYNENDSLRRIRQVSIESVNYKILISFSKILSSTYDSISGMQLEIFTSALNAITTPSTEQNSNNRRLDTLQKRTNTLLSLQSNGGKVDWIPFIRIAREEFLTHIQQKWAEFYSYMDDSRSSAMSMERDDYLSYIQNKYFDFMNAGMRNLLENPVSGFVGYLSTLFKTDLNTALADVIASNHNNHFNDWLAGISPSQRSGNVSSNGLFSTAMIGPQLQSHETNTLQVL